MAMGCFPQKRFRQVGAAGACTDLIGPLLRFLLGLVIQQSAFPGAVVRQHPIVLEAGLRPLLDAIDFEINAIGVVYVIRCRFFHMQTRTDFPVCAAEVFQFVSTGLFEGVNGTKILKKAIFSGENNGGSGGARTRNLCRDRAAL